MPCSEYAKWIIFIQEQQRAASGKGVNILELDEDEAFGQFAGHIE